MKVGIVGGIFDKSSAYRASHRITPETVLADGLSSRGVDVVCAGHLDPFDMDGSDVIHVHHLGAGALRGALDPGRARFVYTHHRPFVGMPTFRSRLLGVDSTELSPGAVRAGAATRLVMRCADAVIALSPWERDVHRRWYHVPPDRQAVIPNGVPAGPFTAAVRALSDPPEVVFVGQLATFKRVDLLLDAVAMLDSPVLVRMVYQVDDRRADLERQVARLGIGDWVVFEGPRPPEGIAALLARACALVLPSAMEALPSVVTEAMLAGVPVVATDVGGVRDQVGEHGFVVPPGSAPALAAAIESVVRDRSGWLAKCGQIRASALERFSVDRMVDDHIELYERMLRGGLSIRRRQRAVQPLRSAASWFVRGDRAVRGASGLEQSH